MSRDYGLLPPAAKRVLWRAVGRYVVGERWWRVKFAKERAAAVRAENVEVARLARLHRPTEALVTVVVPTYQRPDRLAEAVRSALAQTVSDIAVIVVDDGGGQTEGLPRDPRLTVLGLAENHRSPGLARNVALRLSRSTFVAFLDDDNTWRPEHLETALPALESGGGVSLCGCQAAAGAVSG